MDASLWTALLLQAQSVVLAAGEIIKENGQKPRSIHHKGRIDLVTDTDVAVEEFLKHNLKSVFPAASFLAEESSAAAELGESSWIIDPVDGTTNFAHGVPVVGTSVALWHQGRVVLGIVNVPLMGECFTASLGGGAFCNGAPIHVSDVRELSHSLIGTGFPYVLGEDLPDILRRVGSVISTTQGLRRMGAAAVDLAYVAAGRLDAFYEIRLSPWDVAAGWLLVEEAEGKMTSMDGSPYAIRHHAVLASNGHIHDALQRFM